MRTILSFFLSFFIVLVFCGAYVYNIVYAESYANFASNVGEEFDKTGNIDFEKSNNSSEKRGAQVTKMSDGNEFDFAGTLQVNYINFAKDRYNNNDYIDAHYFKTKAMKIKNYKIITPSNPYSFGILPDDMEQFLVAREQLRNVSINSIINSNDGVVLADSYIAFDCWLEAFEEGNSNDRLERCKNRFLDNMKAMRLSLLSQGYNLFDMTTKENLILNNRATSCESCLFYKKGLYCNALYFEPDEAKMIDKMNVVVKRLQRKMSYFASSTITILYYKNAIGFNKKLSNKRINVAKNLIYNTLTKDCPIKPIIRMTPITLSKNASQKRIYRDAITICVGGNE